MKTKMEIDIDIIDPDTCLHCASMNVVNYPVELCADGEVVAVINNFKCDNVKLCEYLKKKISKSATETTPNMEGMKSI